MTVLRFRPHPWGLPEEKKELRILLKATLAIHASIMLWVGSWDLIAVEKRRAYMNDDDALFRSSMDTYLIYTFLGIILCVLTDTFYGNAGLDGGYLHQRYSKPFAVYCFRLALAWVGTMLMWAGLYNLIDLHAFPVDIRAQYRPEIDAGLFFGGLLLMQMSDTFYWVCYLDPEGTVWDYSPTYTSSLRYHLHTAARTLVAVLAQTMLSLAAYDFLENNSPIMGPTTLWRELFYGVFGALLLVWTGAWVPLSWMDLDEEEGENTSNGQEADSNCPEPQPQASTGVYTTLFDLRSLLALIGQLVHNTAVWTFLDLQIFPGEPVRHAVYVIVGMFGLLYTGTLGTNFGMTMLPIVTQRARLHSSDDVMPSTPTARENTPLLPPGFEYESVQ